MAQKDYPFAEELRKSFVEVTIEAGSVLFPEGDKTSTAYFVTDGIVELSRQSFIEGEQTSNIKSEVGVGQIFGASKLLYQKKGQPFEARAKTNCKLLVIDEEIIRLKIKQADPFLQYLIRHGR